MGNIIEIKNLNKSYGDLHAVKDLSFRVEEGEFFAFLGVNGAGKSTTISIICGILKKDSGDVIIDNHQMGKDDDKIKNIIGVVFQNSVLDKQLSVKDNLQIRASLYNITGKAFAEKLKELTTLLDLGEFINRPINKLSGGQKRRVDIARALLNDPKILILDEPTTGLDPKTRKIVWNVLNELRTNRKMTIFLTTHYMEEAADADYVVIINKGEVVANGTPLDLKNQYSGDFITVYNTEEDKIKKLGLSYEIVNNGYRMEVESTKQATDLIIKYPEIFVDYEVTKGKMDDVFLKVTGISGNGE